jgi:hypothetical protein
MDPNDTYVSGLIAEAAALADNAADHDLAALELVSGELHAVLDDCDDAAIVDDADAVIVRITHVISLERHDGMPIAS